ncbi:LD-carboxypeptidase [Mucilaginibacter pallidiroseus]|uniref:LD-carboxypeptidase n=1 Tax=Mucilaginibacter pallidiroseus TaxID=2599295 RepID=A0A563UEJ7_9SPHI|nr:LD-carboxypeptidase [Mucilaginibacter pallidiroseus]TWR29795.1 LD-carboxypeptidase [Mucilaginibacter pallidiroseus]
MRTFDQSHSVIIPPYLKKGNKVAITCPAKKLPIPMTDAINLLTDWGLEVILGDTVNASYHQFAGDDDTRAADMQRFVDDPEIRAIFAARGGYGTIRMIDKVDFAPMVANPKWLVGFSDITLLHAHLISNFNVACIHGQMPLNIPDASAYSLQTLHAALFGDTLNYTLQPNSNNRLGEAAGVLVGGNLSLLIAANGSISDLDYSGKILFLEEVGEYLYATDRMLRSLKRAGKLNDLAGLIIGGFTDMKDNDTPFGQTLPEIVMDVVREYSYPVCFDFPAGHIANNCSLVLGTALTMNVKTHSVEISY